jgi:taurine--2-oxoglutarate transaminase
MFNGLTYSAHPMGCAATIATLDIYKEEKIAENVEKQGKVLAEILDEFEKKHASVGQVRHIGLFSCVELVKSKETREALVPFNNDSEGLMNKIVGMLKVEGFSTYSHENMILVAPPLNITETELREAMAIMDKVLDSVDNMIK